MGLPWSWLLRRVARMQCACSLFELQGPYWSTSSEIRDYSRPSFPMYQTSRVDELAVSSGCICSIVESGSDTCRLKFREDAILFELNGASGVMAAAAK